MKPVEIEFLMKDGLSKGVEKSRESVEQLLDASHRIGEVLSQSGKEGARASDKYNEKLGGLRQGVEKMSASLKAMSVSEKDTASVLMRSSEQNVKFVEAQTARLRMMENTLRSALESGNTALVDSTRKEIETVETWINEALDSIQKNAELIPTIVKNASTKVPEQQTENMRTQLRMLTNEIATATLKYREMSDAERNSAAGKELKNKIEELVKKAGDLRDAMDDVNRSVKSTASDTKNFDALAGGLNIVSSSFGAITGAAAMLGVEEKNLQDIQTKLQASLAISNALSVIQNNLQKESALMIGIRTIREKSATAAIAIRTAAEGKGIIATKSATVAQAAFNLVAKANPYVLLATGILTVVGALAAFTIGSKKAAEAERKQAEEAQKLKEKQEEMAKAIGTATGNAEAKFRSLQQQWNRLKTESEKNKWIKDNADAFKNLGLKVKSVSDAEKVLVKLAPQVISALKAVAEAEAYSGLYKQAIVRRATEWEHRVKGHDTGDTYTIERGGERVRGIYGDDAVKKKDEWVAAGLTGADLKLSRTQPGGNSPYSNYELAQSGIDKVNEYRRQQAIKLNKELEAGYNEEVDFYASKWEEAEQRAAAAKSKIPSSLLDDGGGNGGSGNNGNSTPDRSKLFEEQMRQKREQARRLQELEFSNRQAEIDIMQDGTEKSLDQIQLDHDQKLAAIQRSYEDLIQKRVDEAKRLWELDPKNKNKDFYKSDEFSAASQATEQEVSNFRAQIAAANAMYVRAISDLEVPGIPASFIEKRIESIKSAYAKAVQAIQEEEAQLKASQGGMLTSEQNYAFLQRYANAQEKMENDVKLLEQAEAQRAKQKYDALLDEYKSYDQKRRDIDNKYNEDMAVYEAKRKEIVAAGGDTTDIDASIGERTKQYKHDIQDLKDDILESSDFYTKLFGDISNNGYKVLKDFYAQAKETMDNARTLTDGMEIDITVKDADGKFVKKAVKVTVDEFRNMQKRVKGIRDELEKKNPFTAYKTAWTDLIKAVKNDGDVQGQLKKFNEKGKELTSTIKGWGDSLGAVFGDSFAQSIDEMMTMVDGVMDMGTGIAQIYSGDIVGGITNTLSGLGSIVSMMTSWKDKMEEMKREWYIAEIETERSLREQNAEYAGMRSTISDIIKGTKELDWLVTHGLAKVSSVSLWASQSDELEEYKKNLSTAESKTDELWSKVQGSRGHYEWGNSLNGGSADWSLQGASEAQLELWYNQNKLSDAARDYYEAWKDSNGEVKDLIEKIAELKAQMRDEVTGLSFESFLSKSRDILKELRGDISGLGEFTEDTLSDAILNAFMYQHLAGELEPLYNKLADALIDKTADETFLNQWKEDYADIMSAANTRLKEIAELTGVDVFSDSSRSQNAKSGGFNAMSQDQGTKLEGLFVSGQIHWSSIDDKLTDVSVQFGAAGDTLKKIEEHTSSSASSLEEIKNDIKIIKRDGLKVK